MGWGTASVAWAAWGAFMAGACVLLALVGWSGILCFADSAAFHPIVALDFGLRVEEKASWLSEGCGCGAELEA